MLRDYEGNYEEFLEKNEDEAEKMAVKEERVKEIEKVGRLTLSRVGEARLTAAFAAVSRAA